MASTSRAPNTITITTSTNAGNNAFLDEDEDDSQVTHDGDGTQHEHEHNDDEALAHEENRWVFWLRFLTTMVLLSVAIAVCLVVYFQGRASEQNDFEQDFSDLGDKLVTSFESLVDQRFGIIENFAMGETSYANGSWPFVTPPDFFLRAGSLVMLCQLMFIVLVPKVTFDQRPQWDQYVQQNMAWKKEALAFQEGIPVEQVNAPDGIFPVMMNFHYGGPPKPQDGPGPFHPMWNTFPVNNVSIGNVDIYADTFQQPAIDAAYNSGKPSFGKTEDFWQVSEEEKVQFYYFLHAFDHVQYRDDPIATMYYPIFDGYGQDKEVVASFLCTVYWRTYFDGLLPPGSDGIIVILENTCGQQYTYQVDGQYSHFLGHGDLHHAKYDYLGTGAGIESGSATNDVEDVCQYSIRVYPSQQFEDSYRTDTPWIYAVVLAALFLFTSAVFLFYDYMVEKRQKVVMTSAQQSGKLVSDLFPESVRDQLYQARQEQAKARESQAGWQNNNGADLGGAADSIEHKAAIASLYPKTTIFFADLAGFTKWSSSRTPVEVFQLLEALYGAFDKIAMKRRVYKIETIGDCYVAVTGLPKPQDDHAIIMCKFATDCMKQMNIVTASLAESLGEDTAGLAMRVGLHSGPVTAGVLRGQKSRFQLFGDTVNTASRMESNGERDRIHVSPATAEALIARGKGAWLTPREDKIVAKGKGEMQTYWVIVNARTKSTRSAVSSMPPDSTDGLADLPQFENEGMPNGQSMQDSGISI
ncbi:Receptor-type guanylate cyclase gcy [Seminavis robusta]|uniref:Receptor-type guanylate cyclase gcy n=1 Tax=Seminavis robusta TaxID=568900 RepID=A0A9N8H760_9STRA|nr:Receptor-type guanylate cyclase gcy [Seminavis robusta]|eukprot:Sro193_g082630.1 Receptor-type guanylate cyclase gcy (752) ;mRNA; r:82292-84826